MIRNAFQSLCEWKNRPRHSPLLIRGARQVGKTFLVEAFGTRHYPHFLSVNFEDQPECKAAFEQSFDPRSILASLSLITQRKIEAENTLLFLDEIQECPRAIQALRYFKEKMPELDVIAAGSLLEFVLNEADFRMPVGRIEFLYMKPLSFHEFLLATEHVTLHNFLSEVQLNSPFPLEFHQQLLGLVRQYIALGGMPAVVQTFIEQGQFSACERVQSSLLQTYQDDFGKYAVKVQHLKNIFAKLPAVLNQQCKYSALDPEIKAETIKKSLYALQLAGLIYPVYASAATGLPLSAYQLEKKFKLLFVDVGLMGRAQHLPLELLINVQDTLILNKGLLVEQFVGQELLAYQAEYEPAALHYWYRDKTGSQAEVDYILALQGKIIPVEVKSGHSHWLKSLKMLMETQKLPLGVRISEHPLHYQGGILSLPLYMIHELSRFLVFL